MSNTMKYAQVSVDARVVHKLTFDYTIPDLLDVKIGQLVRVPFGTRILHGIILSISSKPRVSVTREIIETVKDVPILSDLQMRLARWISDHYLTTMFSSITVMLPPGALIREKIYISIGDSCKNTTLELTAYQERIIKYIGGKKKVEEKRLIEVMGRGARVAVNRLVECGMLYRIVQQPRPSVRRKYIEHVKLSSEATVELSKLSKNAFRQKELIKRLLGDVRSMTMVEARKEFGSASINSLIKKGLLVIESTVVDRDPLFGRDYPPTKNMVLNIAQASTAKEVKFALGDSKSMPRTFLLEGVTGSGKTEVYLDAVENCLKIGKRAIVLVPEISMAPQTIERFSSRFRGNVGVLHSGLTAGQRLDQWLKISKGEYGVVIGSRSAVFAPQPELGLIVVDEEHEWTYKQHDALPRYHARDVAMKISDINGTVVLLGSATPDVCTYHRAKNGVIKLLRLPERFILGSSFDKSDVRQSSLAAVEIVNMSDELRSGNNTMLSHALTRGIKDCIRSGSQAILFINRRGSAGTVQCRDCGYVFFCRRCEVTMTCHRDQGQMLCHYCGDRMSLPNRCDKCLGFSLYQHGIGTQFVEKEIKRLFPEINVIRWDRDSTKNASSHEVILEKFRSGESQILVGTQMIAKGLHLPSVTLVGVVLADIGLSLPDYRAAERAFQLLCQVAGRAGRGKSKGKVVVQTYRPNSYPIKGAATQDYPAFYTEELKHRNEQNNPPYNNIVRLVYSHRNNALCEREGIRLSEHLKVERNVRALSEIEILGPTPSYPSRLRGSYRWQLILRGKNYRDLLDNVTIPESWAIDVDPVGLN